MNWSKSYVSKLLQHQIHDHNPRQKKTKHLLACHFISDTRKKEIQWKILWEKPYTHTHKKKACFQKLIERDNNIIRVVCSIDVFMAGYPSWFCWRPQVFNCKCFEWSLPVCRQNHQWNHDANSNHWFTTSFLWRKVPEGGARSVTTTLTDPDSVGPVQQGSRNYAGSEMRGGTSKQRLIALTEKTQ